MESTIYTVGGKEFELQHYGVKGMKWGVRKAREEYKKLDQAKAKYKHAKKAYDRSFGYYYQNSKQGYSLNRVNRMQNTERFKDSVRDAKRLDKAKKEYKAQKANVRKNAPVAAKLERGARAVGRGLAVVGGMAVVDHVYFGGAGRKMAKAAVTKAYNSVMDQTFQYSVLDKAGNVLRRYN
jgi:hypothetical protein